jgi:hypothetical protein
MSRNILSDKRIRIIIGHYGSGKTEFAVNYAMKLSKEGKKVAIADLDIVNPYFRSRERASVMEQNGIEVISSSLGHNSSLDLPSISAAISGPITNNKYDVVLDVGGDPVGARALARFVEDIENDEYEMLFIANMYRPSTQNAKDIIKFIRDIEDTCGLSVTGLVNNSHMLRDTKAKDIIDTQPILEEVSKLTGIPIKYVSIIESQADFLDKEYFDKIFPIKMYMRDTWM